MYSRKKYDLYKLLILYWTQSPHSKGANLIYRHVIQKPKKYDTPTEEEEEAIVAVQPKENFRYIDGFQPPHLMSTRHSNSSSSSSSEEDDQPVINTTASTPSEKEVCPKNMQGNRYNS
jgi:hypothetical protein